jgi:hypothetical protein
LRRKGNNPNEFTQADERIIPSFIIGYKGTSNEETLEKNFIKPRDMRYPNGVLILEGEIFYGTSSAGNWHIGKGKAECIFSFLSCISETISYTNKNNFKLHDYVNLLNESNT